MENNKFWIEYCKRVRDSYIKDIERGQKSKVRLEEELCIVNDYLEKDKYIVEKQNIMIARMENGEFFSTIVDEITFIKPAGCLIGDSK